MMNNKWKNLRKTKATSLAWKKRVCLLYLPNAKCPTITKVSYDDDGGGGGGGANNINYNAGNVNSCNYM